MNGGRELVQFQSNNPHLHIKAASTQQGFGLLAAAPDPAGANLAKTALTFGTSGATALATRAAHHILDALMAPDGGPTQDLPADYQGLLAKALLVHSSSWGESAETLESICGPSDPRRYSERKDNVTRLLGYGLVDVERALECTRNRVTLVGWGAVMPGAAKLFRVPLPPSLDGKTDFRAITITLAWFAPVDARHQGYRMATLDVDPGGDPNYSLAVERAKMQPSFTTVKRGSVVQDRREGARAAAYVDGGDLLVRVSCRATTDAYVTEAVPFTFALTLDVGVETDVEVYAEVRASIEARARALLEL